MQKYLLSLLLIIGFDTSAQHLEVIAEKPGVSLRGLSVVNDKVLWVSGSKGTVGRSVDAGKTWTWITVRDFEKRDFRDIEAFSDKVAVIIAVAAPAVILRTENGGDTWQTTYQNDNKDMFLDAMEFSDDLHGTVVGDPIARVFFLASTTDGGKSWKEEIRKMPLADSTEGCFASSGTNIRMAGMIPVFVSGGVKSKVYYKDKAIVLPFAQGNTTTGANSIALKSLPPTWIVAGGDFRKDSVATDNCYISHDEGKTWRSPLAGPAGYRSCVEFVSNDIFITCGLNGVDISTDGGNVWKRISRTGFHACRKAKNGKSVFLSGNGRIGKVIP